jgi:hypothetical protein
MRASMTRAARLTCVVTALGVGVVTLPARVFAQG